MRHGIKLNDILRCQSFFFFLVQNFILLTSCLFERFFYVSLLHTLLVLLPQDAPNETNPSGNGPTYTWKRGHLSNQLRLSLKLLIVIPKPVWNAFCTFHCDSIEGKSSTLRYMRKPILNLDIWSKHICLAGSITQPPNVHKNEQFGVKEL